MNITIDRLLLRNFKNHQHFFYPLGSITRLTGANGAGKSTIGEAIAWCLYGTDILGNMLIKTLSPEPTTYPFDHVAVELLLSVDGKQVLLERRIENGDTQYYTNEVPAKATAYKELVDSLFDKNLFLSLFSPAYFFSQKWEDQRAQVLKNAIPPANKEVFAVLPKPQADKLSELLKKHNIDELEAKHRDNKNRQEKALIAAAASVKTLQEQLTLVASLTADDIHKLNEQLADTDAKIQQKEAEEKKHREYNEKTALLRMELKNLVEQADGLKVQFTAKRDKPPADACDKCGQPLTDEALEKATATHTAELEAFKQRHTELVAQHKVKLAELKELEPAEYDQVELLRLRESRHELGNQIQVAGAQQQLQSALDEAKAKEKDTEASFKDSVFVLDAIKSYRAKEAEMMAAKVQDLFQTLTIQLFQENKGDGEKKPFFEIYMDGKPYRKLSAGERIKAGLELIEVLSKQNNVVAPCFIDGAESYTGKIEVMGQAIICRAVFPTEENGCGKFTVTEG